MLQAAAKQLIQHLDHPIGQFEIDGRVCVGTGPMAEGRWTWTDEAAGTLQLQDVMRPHPEGFSVLLQQRGKKKNRAGRPAWCAFSISGALVI